MLTDRRAVGTDLPSTRRTGLAFWQLWLALAAILLLGAHLRFLNLYEWDDDAYLHPDERFIVYTVYNLRVPRSPGDYFKSICAVNGEVPSPSSTVDLAGRQLPPDQYEPSLESGCNTLNPRSYGWSGFFVYGTLPTSLTRLVAEAGHARSHPGDTRPIPPAEIRNVGRTLSALFDMGSVLLTFLIARRLYGVRAGLLAGLLYACAALPIQLAHFFTVDAATGFFVLLAAYWSVRAAQGGGLGTFLALGLSIGGAMACRITMATLGVLAVAAVAARVFEQRRTRPAPGGEMQGSRARRSSLLGLAGMLILAGIVTVLSFRVLAPDTFIGTSFIDVRPDARFLSSIKNVSGYVSGAIDAPFSQQWANRTPFLFPLTNMIVWGMGIPFGVTAWLAFATAAWLLVRRRDLRHLIPVLWVGFYFAWQGGQFGMTMRYYASLYGLLAALAAWDVLALTDLLARWAKSRQPASEIGRSGAAWLSGLAAHIPLLVVLAGTVIWAFGVTAIYTRPHSRIEASRWIFANIPAGSTITSEIWDDPLPLKVDERDPNQYTILKTAPYQEDDLIKYTGYVAQDGTVVPGLIAQLDQADYIVLSSNRVYDSATRLPMRYPALTRYYHTLFNGELGFDLVADVRSYPTLFGVPIPDQGAEEAFSVYDHPRVLIFEKSARYASANTARLLTSEVAWDEVYKIPTVRVRQVPTALRLTEAQWPAYRQAGTWTELFSPASLGSRVPWLIWLVILELIGLAAFALLFRPLAALADRGFALARMLGLLLVAYPAWLLGSLRLAAFTPATLWLCALPLLACGAAAAWLQRHALVEFGRRKRGALLVSEGMFLAAFLAFLAIRALNPDLWHPVRAGEKSLELASLTAVLKSAAFPPYDPWFAGGYMNTPYFGMVLVGALAHLAGVVPNVAFNLAVPTLFALAATGAWSVAYNLTAPRARLAHARVPIAQQAELAEPAPAARSLTGRRLERRAIVGGLLAALFVAVAGNLAQAFWMLPGTARPSAVLPAGGPGWLPASYAAQQSALGRGEWAYWDATRTAGYALNDGVVTEFPFAGFLFGDLQAHILGLPLGLLALALLAALLHGSSGLSRAHRAPLRGIQPLHLALLGLALGALRATSSWDYPGMLGLILLTLGLVAWGEQRRGGRLQAVLARLGLRAALVIGLAWLLFLPFTRSFASGYAGLAPWFGARIPAAELLKIDGLWLFALASGGALLYRRAGRLGRAPLLVILAAALLLTLLTALAGLPALIPLALLMAGALVLLMDLGMRLRSYDDDPASSPPEAGGRSLLLVLWGLFALGLTLIADLVVARGAGGRTETVLKLGVQSWVIFAVVSAAALCWAWGRMGRAGVAGRIWQALALLLGLAALAYPLSATPARIADRAAPQAGATLDGMAVLPGATWEENGRRFSLAEDATAIGWMRDSIAGTPIILEAQTEDYRWGGRVAAYTGLPTLLGWPGQQLEQRRVAGVEPVLESRRQLIQQIYGGADADATLRALQLYGVEYVYVGQLERALYSPAGLAKFDAMVQAGRIRGVFSAGETRIYQVPAADHPPAVLTTSLPTTPPSGPDTSAPAMLDGRVGDLPVSDPYPQFGRASLAEQAAALALWLLAWLGLQLLGMPLAALAFGRPGRWSDGGYAWARPIGLILLGYVVWLPASLGRWHYDRAGLLIGALLVLLTDLALLWWLGRAHDKAPDDGHPTTAMPGRQIAAGLRLLARHYWSRRLQVAQVELLALAAFLALLGLRALNPDLWQPYWGGEKPFEFGLLNAVLRSPSMPPYSPFYSDGTVNYYYYGFFLVSLVVKATAIAPSVAFNLIVPTLFGMFVAGVFAAGARISGRAWAGLAAAGMVAVAGNPAAAFRVGWSEGLGPVLAALASWPGNFGSQLGAWFVGPSRVIPNTINEFPLWGFLFADLHPHLIAMPLTLLVIALAYELVGRGGAEPRAENKERNKGTREQGARATEPQDQEYRTLEPQNSRAEGREPRAAELQSPKAESQAAMGGIEPPATSYQLPATSHQPSFAEPPSIVHRLSSIARPAIIYALAALTLGTLAVTNSWDFPTYALLLGGALAGRAWRAHPTPARRLTGVVLGLLGAGLVAGAGALLFLPFFQSFKSPVGGIGEVTTPTELRDYLLIYGLPLALVVPATLMAAWRLLGTTRRASPAALGLVARPIDASLVPQALVAVAGLIVAVSVALAVTPLPIPASPGIRIWLLILLLACAPTLLARRVSPATWFGAWLAALALAVSLGFELVYVRDHLAGGDWYRMNTVFKFGLQVWVLLGLAAAAALPGFVRALRRAGLLASALGAGVLTALVVLALTFPLAGIPSRTAYRFRESPVPTLDGLAFLERSIYYVYPQYLGLPEGSFEPVPIALRHDADAIRWLNSTVEGTPVVIQSSAEFYRLYGVRVAANTGLPTVVSPLHEAEQRTAADVYARDRDVQLFYRTNDPGEALRVIAKYHIGYVYIGPIERLVYGTAGMAKFEELARPQGPLSLAYQNDGVSIYQVKPVAYTLAEAAGPAGAAPAGEEASLGALEQQVAAAPEDLGAAWQLAQRYADRGRFDDAAKVLEPHAIARPGDAGVQHFYGDLLNLAGRADEAEQAYRRAVNASPSASNYTKLGSALLQWGRLDDAEQALALAIQADPDQPTAYFFLGQAAEERGQTNRAADYFQQFLDRADPSDPLRPDAEAALQRLVAR